MRRRLTLTLSPRWDQYVYAAVSGTVGAISVLLSGVTAKLIIESPDAFAKVPSSCSTTAPTHREPKTPLPMSAGAALALALALTS